jgi:hypothetical protein
MKESIKNEEDRIVIFMLFIFFIGWFIVKIEVALTALVIFIGLRIFRSGLPKIKSYLLTPSGSGEKQDG